MEFNVGDRVRSICLEERYEGREGVVTAFNPDKKYPFKVEFSDGKEPADGWFAKDEVEAMETQPIIEAHWGDRNLMESRSRGCIH